MARCPDRRPQGAATVLAPGAAAALRRAAVGGVSGSFRHPGGLSRSGHSPELSRNPLRGAARHGRQPGRRRRRDLVDLPSDRSVWTARGAATEILPPSSAPSASFVSWPPLLPLAADPHEDSWNFLGVSTALSRLSWRGLASSGARLIPGKGSVVLATSTAARARVCDSNDPGGRPQPTRSGRRPLSRKTHARAPETRPVSSHREPSGSGSAAVVLKPPRAVD